MVIKLWADYRGLGLGARLGSITRALSSWGSKIFPNFDIEISKVKKQLEEV